MLSAPFINDQQLLSKKVENSLTDWNISSEVFIGDPRLIIHNYFHVVPPRKIKFDLKKTKNEKLRLLSDTFTCTWTVESRYHLSFPLLMLKQEKHKKEFWCTRVGRFESVRLYQISPVNHNISIVFADTTEGGQDEWTCVFECRGLNHSRTSCVMTGNNLFKYIQNWQGGSNVNVISGHTLSPNIWFNVWLSRQVESPWHQRSLITLLALTTFDFRISFSMVIGRCTERISYVLMLWKLVSSVFIVAHLL